MVDIEYRITEASAYKAIANVMHIREAVHVNAAVNARPSATNLSQTVGPECGKSEYPSRDQYAGDFLKYRLRFRGPGQQLIRDNHVERPIAKRQLAGITLNE